MQYTYEFQTQLAAADQGNNDYSFYGNDQNVGRLSISADGTVLANIGSMDGSVQEWGACLWLQPNATEDATDLDDSKVVGKLGVHAGEAATTSGVGLEGQWTTGAVDNLDTVVTCGDVRLSRPDDLQHESRLYRLHRHCWAQRQHANNRQVLRLYWTLGIGSGPGFISAAGDFFNYGICANGQAGATEEIASISWLLL